MSPSNNNSDSQPSSSLRPMMRRKSSAQNLLSSFKAATSGSSSNSGANNSNGNNNNNNNNNNGSSNGHGGVSGNNGGSSAGTINGNSNGVVSVVASLASSMNGIHPLLPPTVLAPSPLPPPPSASASSSAIPTPSTSGTSTPALPPFAMHHAAQAQQQQPGAVPATAPILAPAATAATPTAREWDAQSLHADSASVPTATGFFSPVGTGVIGTGAGNSGSPGATVEYLRDLVQKRIMTLTYTRSVHDGRTHWFHTIMMSRADLDRVFNNTAMKKRTHRFAILAMSLSSLFDITQPTDCLRSALNMLTEYEQAKEDSDRPKMILYSQRLWKRPPKRHAGMNDYPLGMPDTSDTYLTIPHMPFPLDYTQTLLSLLDILSAFYAKLAKLLGPSPFPHASQHMLGLSPHPGVSYLFQNQTPASAADEALWNVALGSTALGNPLGGSVLNSPPPSWTPALGELVLKVDSKFKKIISVLLKDLDVFARDSIREELASLDPLLRNVGGWGAPSGTYEFDPS